MKRDLLREWVRIAWHLDGMTLDRYLDLSIRDALELHDALTDQIYLVNDTQDLPLRPKEWRK